MALSSEVWTLLSRPTVLSGMEKDPNASPTKVAEELFGKKVVKEIKSEDEDAKPGYPQQETASIAQEELDRAATTGSFPRRPSDLFLKIYIEVLRTLQNDPLSGMCSPALLPSSGVLQLSICSVIPDIIRHMADVIVQAENEIFLATNYWEASTAAAMISDSLRQLSKRVAERGGRKVVVKLMYDRGTPKQLFENRQIVPVDTYTGDAVRLPHPEEVPNLDLEVMNYHRPVVGTFHAKYMVVDRRIAILQSNNIQDRVNVEMMVHIEGPVVEAFYELALLSWGHVLNPPLPLLSGPAPILASYSCGQDHPHIAAKGLEKSRVQGQVLRTNQNRPQDNEGMCGMKVATKIFPSGSASVPATTVQPPNCGRRQATGDQNGAGGAGVPVTSGITDDEVQTVLEEKFSTMKLVTAHLNTNLQPDTTGDEPDNADAARFRPHIVHSPHDPVPMVLVNRKPRGTPTPGPVDNPQDAAFLAAFKYAQRNVFIQSPTLNAAPVIVAALGAVRRGVEVTLYLDLGYNDAGEMLPMQGGTNEQVVAKMYSELEEGAKQNLKVYWYVGKDQRRPVGASLEKRNCHVKLMIIDDAVGIQGNGNQDTQSWFHSQEVNVMIDSPTIMKEWRTGLDANQNTLKYGQVQYDGVWRDENGQPLKDAAGPNTGGFFGSLKGFKGAIDRVRGTGGF